MNDHRFPNRRRFLKAATGAALGALGGLNLPTVNAARPPAPDKPGDAPLFRFVQWNDLHVDTTKPPAYSLANKKAAWLIDWVNSRKPNGRFDFVVGVGDLIQGGNLPSLAKDSETLKKLTKGLSVPLHIALGNHENIAREGDAKYEKSFCDAFGLKQTNYTFRHKDVMFVMLNDSGAPWRNDKPVGRRRDAWFRRVLESSPDTPKIVCCHIPLVPVRDEKILTKSFGFRGKTARDDELIKLVDEHADSIAAVLSGHLHLTGTVERNGVHHITISGTASYPCDFAAYEVFPDRIRVRVHSLPRKLVTPETNLHGKPRHKKDFTDPDHKTPEAYLKGNASEREFEIELQHKISPSKPPLPAHKSPMS